MKLTESELETLTMLSLSNKEIAKRRVVSVCTVKTQINHIFNKMSVPSRIQAICKALKTGIINLEQLITE